MAPTVMPLNFIEVIPEIHQIPCTQESAKTTSGKWTLEVHNYRNSPESPALLKKLEEQAELLRKAIGDPPIGFDAHGAIDFPTPSNSKFPITISVNSPFYHYYCDNGKLEVADEYSDEAWIVSNPKGGGPFKIGSKNFRLLGSPIGEIRGYPAFEHDWTGDLTGNCATFTWTVLVTKKGKSPYHYASRKEILEHCFAVVEKQRPVHLAGCDYMPIRPADVQAAEKQKELASFLLGAKDDATRKTRTDRFNNDYRTDQQLLEECRQKMKAMDDQTFARLELVRDRYSQEELMQTAYVFKWLTNYDNEFTENDFEFDFPKIDPDCRPADYGGNCDPERMGKPFVLLNRDYLDPSLTNTSPQYFSVGIKWTACKANKFHNEAGEKMRDDFFKRFDFDRLADMLGK